LNWAPYSYVRRRLKSGDSSSNILNGRLARSNIVNKRFFEDRGEAILATLQIRRPEGRMNLL